MHISRIALFTARITDGISSQNTRVSRVHERVHVMSRFARCIARMRSHAAANAKCMYDQQLLIPFDFIISLRRIFLQIYILRCLNIFLIFFSHYILRSSAISLTRMKIKEELHNILHEYSLFASCKINYINYIALIIL